MNDLPEPLASNLVEYTVGELAHAIKRTVEGAFGRVRLRGEISGFKGRHASGHCYFTLKDDKSCIEAVIWKSEYLRLKFKPEQGLEVVVTGRVTTYPSSSKYQIVIEQLEPAGAGALMALLEARKKSLAAEGLFDEARKQPLPFLPRRIGVVTSPTGAVIRDILHRLADRFPSHVIIWPVRVQGETCAGEVAAAIAGLNALDPRPDLIIVARGGGSLEDLWGFNEETVVRAAAESRIPLISAIGHETDWTLLDLVADWRAPTPTAAAERAVPVRSELLARVARLIAQLHGCERRMIDRLRTHLRALSRGLPRPGDLLDLPRQRFDAASLRLRWALRANAKAHGALLQRSAIRLRPHLLLSTTRRGREALTGLDRRSARAVAQRLGRRRERLDSHAKLLGSLGYRNVVSRGFALVRDGDGKTVRRAADVAPFEALDIELAEGRVQARAETRPSPRRKAARRGPAVQESLF